MSIDGGISRFFTSGHKIQRATTTRDDHGDTLLSWTDHITHINGKLWFVRGREQIDAHKLTYFVDARFATMPGSLDITEQDRYVSPDGTAYHIRAVAIRTRPDGTGHLELDLEMIR